MATVRKRTWGDGKEAWVVAYTDNDGKRRLQTFKTEEAAQIGRKIVERDSDSARLAQMMRGRR
jgi:hypothetical protein